MRSVLGASSSAAYGVLPLVLLGAMAVLVRPELGFAEDGLGVAVAFFFLASGLTSSSGGRFVSFLGARRGVLLAGIIGSSSLAGVALLSRSWVTLVVFLVLGGTAHGIAQPASSLALSQLISAKRQGIECPGDEIRWIHQCHGGVARRQDESSADALQGAEADQHFHGGSKRSGETRRGKENDCQAEHSRDTNRVEKWT